MFTYREFADGTHRYRQRVPPIDRDYEEARSENELAVISLSRTTDPRHLATILTHLSKMTEEFGQTVYEDCIRMSALFTYYKTIAQECGLASTVFDEIYARTHPYYTTSTGGLIFKIRPDEKHDDSLWSVKVKVPLTPTLGRVRTIIHEYFVAMVALNPLRVTIPSFAYAFSYAHCGSLMAGLDTIVNSLCATPGTRPMMIYEGNEGAEPLFKLLREDNSPKLVTILNYLLQLMGALHMAHDYADYTHYDLHSNNVLVETLEGPIKLEFQEYSIMTPDVVLIIDNGMAFCTYERPEILAPLRRTAPRFPSADAVEIFATSGDDVERLQNTRMIHYGSIQNHVLGVSNNRSYPLGDVFRIFFDIYSLCAVELQEQLKPLVGHFFKDADMGQRLSGTTEHASSMVNSFALPPFREDLYSYRYSDFSREILRRYGPLLESLVTIRDKPWKISHSAPGVRLEHAFNWRVPEPSHIPSLYDVGITEILVPGSRAPVKLGKSQDAVRELRDMGSRFNDLIYRTHWVDLTIYESQDMTMELMMSREFSDNYLHVLRRCVNLVQSARIIYSNARILFHGMRVIGVDKPQEILAHVLAVEPDDLTSLGAYCRKIKLPDKVQHKFRIMLSLTEKIERTLIPGPQIRRTDMMNWYRACLPSTKIHLEFGVNWGMVSGELSLPDLETEC